MRPIKKLVLTLIAFIFLVESVQAVVLEYYIVVEENGNSLVIITIDGSGLVSIPISQDVEEVRVQGALYSLNDGNLEVSIGSTEHAVVLYKTSTLTRKSEESWSFQIDLSNEEKNHTTVAMPKNTNIKKTSPPALIESTNFKKLMWEGNISQISVDYYFESEIPDDIIDPDEDPQGISYLIPILVIGLVVASTFGVIYFRRKNSLKNKENILKTLPMNENKIMEVLLENNGEMKRSKLEKTSGISKSSLAASLKNLEKKKIIEVDKTYKSHYVKLTKWFNEL
jgi:uncharacterized membrane protein